MIEVSNSTAQTLQPRESMTFDRVIHDRGCGECFSRQSPTSVKLRGGCGAIYDVEFAGNITSATAGAAIQLAIALQGTALVETGMNAMPAAAGDLWNVATGTYVSMDCSDLDRVSVINSGTTPVTIAPNSNLRIRRVA